MNQAKELYERMKKEIDNRKPKDFNGYEGWLLDGLERAIYAIEIAKKYFSIRGEE